MSLGPMSPFWGWAFVAVLATLLVGLPLGWSRLAGHGKILLLVRTGALLAVAASALGAAAFPLNATFQWYSTWASVRQSLSQEAPPTVTASHAGAPARSAVTTHRPSPFDGQNPSATRGQLQLAPTPYGRGFLQTFTVRGATSGHSGQVLVWLPPSYPKQKGEKAVQNFPVIEAFHGYPATPDTALRSFHLDDALVDLAAQKKMREAVIVMPDWSPQGTDTECVDGNPNGPRMETWLTVDIPQWVHDNFHVASDRASWATFGYSAGGWCALMGSMLHADTFGASISLSGYARPAFSAAYEPFTTSDPRAIRYDLVRGAGAAPPPIAIWTLSADEDILSYPTTTALAAVTRAPMSATSTTLGHGDHRVGAWTPYVRPALEWLAEAAPRVRPCPGLTRRSAVRAGGIPIQSRKVRAINCIR